MTEKRDSRFFRALLLGGMECKAISLRELCRRSRTDPSLLSKIISGKRNPPLDDAAIENIASALDLNPAELHVAAGRLPESWRELAENRELFEQVDALVCGTRPAAAPTAKKPEQSAPRPAAKRHLPDELL
jgi:transcriptional regulator with XRE-family HTH domain